MITLDSFLTALQRVETGSEPDHGRGALGDNGKALGPLQIHGSLYLDAMEFLANDIGVPVDRLLSNIPYKFCAEQIFSRLVAWLYFKRYFKQELEGGNWEVLARAWNGGPKYWEESGRLSRTTQYWHKVRTQLAKISKKGAL